MSEKRHRILIVDDVPQNISILTEILKNDFVLSAATNGAKALQIAQSEKPPDLILLDIIMPEMDGFEVMEKLKEDNRTRDIPVVFVTAESDQDSKMRGTELGVSWYITKPIRPDFVKSVVQNVLS